MTIQDDRADWSSALGSLALPDVLMRSQFTDMQRSHEMTPEQRLMFAVLQGGIADATSQRLRSGKGMRLQAEALAWVEALKDRGVYSFHNCCEVFGFDAKAIRRAIQGYVDAQTEIKVRGNNVRPRDLLTVPKKPRVRKAA